MNKTLILKRSRLCGAVMAVLCGIAVLVLYSLTWTSITGIFAEEISPYSAIMESYLDGSWTSTGEVIQFGLVVLTVVMEAFTLMLLLLRMYELQAVGALMSGGVVAYYALWVIQCQHEYEASRGFWSSLAYVLRLHRQTITDVPYQTAIVGGVQAVLGICCLLLCLAVRTAEVSEVVTEQLGSADYPEEDGVDEDVEDGDSCEE